MSDEDDDGPVVRSRRKLRNYVSDSLFDGALEVVQDSTTVKPIEVFQESDSILSPPIDSKQAEKQQQKQQEHQPVQQLNHDLTSTTTAASLVPKRKSDLKPSGDHTASKPSKPSVRSSSEQTVQSVPTVQGPASTRKPDSSVGRKPATDVSTPKELKQRSTRETTTSTASATGTSRKRLLSKQISNRTAVKEEIASPAAQKRSGLTRVDIKNLSDGPSSSIPAETGGFKAGQRYVCPPVGDGTRAFYESLLKENPNSLLATRYCIEHGVLIGTQHKEQFLIYQMLRDLGAFKGGQGGISKRFMNGLAAEDIAAWQKSRRGGVATKAAKVKPDPTTVTSPSRTSASATSRRQSHS